jgi:predicted dehydrogenase
MTKEISIGIIGTGFGKMIGLNFKAVFPKCKIYYFGRNPIKLASVASEVGAEATYSNWKKMVDNPKINFIVIASPSGLHKEMFEYISKTGKNILIEKPAALSSDEVNSINSISIKSGCFVVVNHEGRFNPVVTYLKKLIDSKKFGDILTVRISAYLNWYSSPEYKETWNNSITLGGGQIFSVGTHQIDLARYLLGMPKFVSGSVHAGTYQDPRFKKRATSDDRFSATFITKESTFVELFNDCYCQGHKDFLIEIIGSKGIALYSDQKGLSLSFGNDELPKPIKIVDPLAKITYGNSVLSKSMKYMTNALIEYIKTGKKDSRFCSLIEERENLELFEKYKKTI